MEEGLVGLEDHLVPDLVLLREVEPGTVHGLLLPIPIKEHPSSALMVKLNHTLEFGKNQILDLDLAARVPSNRNRLVALIRVEIVGFLALLPKDLQSQLGQLGFTGGSLRHGELRVGVFLVFFPPSAVLVSGG